MSVVDAAALLVDVDIMYSYNAAIMFFFAPVALYRFDDRISISVNAVSVLSMWLMKNLNLCRCIANRCTLENTCLEELGIKVNGANINIRFF